MIYYWHEDHVTSFKKSKMLAALSSEEDVDVYYGY